MQTDKIKEKIVLIPELIFKFRCQLVDLTSEKKLINKKIDFRESLLMNHIAQEQDNGKPRYANETARKAALSIKLMEDAEAVANEKRAQELDLLIQGLELEIEQLQYEFRAYEAVLRSIF